MVSHSGEWVRPPHVAAQPLTEAELGIQAVLERERKYRDRRTHQLAGEWRSANPDGSHGAEYVAGSPTRGCYVPSINAIPRTEAQRSHEAMTEIMEPETGVGLYTRGGDGFDGLFRNVLRTMLKRKLKREGRMARGTWLGQEEGPRTKKGKLRKPRPKASVWNVVAIIIVILLSSPPWPGTP